MLISIHALREEGDIGQTKICLPWSAISIHALREEGDRIASPHLETHSDFYPRPPRGGRQQRLQSMIDLPEISIHALREEGDRITVIQLYANISFLSTPSMRRATHRPGSPPGAITFLSTPSMRRATSVPVSLPEPF